MKPQRHRALRLKVLLALAIVAVATGYRVNDDAARGVDAQAMSTQAPTIAVVQATATTPAR